MSSGEITPPCGAPSPVGVKRPFSITPAFSHRRIMSRAGNNPIVASSWSWSMWSNAPARSASRIHNRLAFLPRSVVKIIAIASWQERPGRNP
jgi:hypothetical protein